MFFDSLSLLKGSTLVKILKPRTEKYLFVLKKWFVLSQMEINLELTTSCGEVSDENANAGSR